MEATSWWHERVFGGLASTGSTSTWGTWTQRCARKTRCGAASPTTSARPSSTSPRRSMSWPTGPTGARHLSLELLARLRHPGPARGGRLARRAGAAARPPVDARRGGAGVARRADARRRRPPDRRDVAAGADGAGAPSRRGVRRGAGEGAWGRLGGRVGEVLRQNWDLEHWAAFQGGFLDLGADAVRSPPAAAAGRRVRHLPLRRRPPQLCRRAWADPDTGQHLDCASSRPRARRSASRCRA